MTRRKGLAEEPPPFAPASDALRSVALARLKVDSAGRIVIPAEMRTAMMVKAGDTVTAEVVDGELRAMSRPVVLARVRTHAERFKAGHPGASVVDELIAERRAEAQRDLEEANAWRKAHGLPPLEPE